MTVGVVIVGAGQSGLNVASRLRELGYDKSIMLLGDEVHMPYQRPPLSKKFLSGAIDSQSLMLRPDSFFQDRRIDLALGVQGIALDTTSQRLGLSDGRSLNYESLVLATGTRARELPGKLGGGLRGVHVLRDLDQAVALQGQMISGNHLVVVGGGFVGLEVAATARQANMHVTVLEQASRILQRVAGHEVSRRVAALHRSHGVQILEQQQLTGLRGQDAVVREVSLTDGRVLPADLVLVGIGAIPNTELAQAGGLEVCDGIVVNANGLTSAPNVYACGDCARFPWGKDSIRLESVHHAIAHSDSIAQAITGRTVTYSQSPGFGPISSTANCRWWACV